MKEIEIVKSFYAAMNRNDIAAVMSYCSPDIVREEWPGLPTASTHRGLEEFEDHLKKGRSTWAEGSCNPDEIKIFGNKALVTVHVNVRQKDKTEWIDGYVADVFTFKDSKVTEFYSYLDNQKALEWARS